MTLTILTVMLIFSKFLFSKGVKQAITLLKKKKKDPKSDRRVLLKTILPQILTQFAEVAIKPN